MLINFDFDGVIADSLAPLLALCRTAQENVGEGRPPLIEDFQTIEDLTFSGMAERLGIVKKARMFTEKAILMQHCQKEMPKVFPEIVPVIKRLGNTHRLTVISASSRQMIQKTLEANDLTASVSLICGGDHGETKQESLLRVMAEFSASPDTTYMIGDTINDIRQGKKAGVRTIGAGWGFQSPALLDREAPDYLAPTPEALENFLIKEDAKN